MTEATLAGAKILTRTPAGYRNGKPPAPSRPPPPLHPGARRMRRAVATVGPLEGLATAAGYQVESAGTLPLLRYITAVRPAN